MPPSSSGGDTSSLEARFRVSINGNNMCHCVHVEELIEEVKEIKDKLKTNAQGPKDDPWFRPRADHQQERPGVQDGGGGRRHAQGSLPLHLP